MAHNRRTTTPRTLLQAMQADLTDVILCLDIMRVHGAFREREPSEK